MRYLSIVKWLDNMRGMYGRHLVQMGDLMFELHVDNEYSNDSPRQDLNAFWVGLALGINTSTSI